MVHNIWLGQHCLLSLVHFNFKIYVLIPSLIKKNLFLPRNFKSPVTCITDAWTGDAYVHQWSGSPSIGSRAKLCDDTRNTLNMQHITPILKIWSEGRAGSDAVGTGYTKFGQHQWVILSFSRAIGACWRKTLPENYYPIFRLVRHNFARPGCFPYILSYCYLFSLLSSDWFLIAVCSFVSVRELVKW